MPSAAAAAGSSMDGPEHLLRRQRQQALLWSAVIIFSIAFFSAVAACVIPRAPSGMPFHQTSTFARGAAGVPLLAAFVLAALAACFAALILCSQELLVRPLLPDTPATTDRIFWATSVAIRFAFLAVLSGAGRFFTTAPSGGGRDTSPLDDTPYRLPLMALWYAAYCCDLIQVKRRPGGVSAAFVAQMVPHHYLSMGIVGVWILFLAPPDAGGAPMWNTIIIYLCACLPNHLYKLATSIHRPSWAPLLIYPATAGHWGLLLASQAYYFTHCPCSQWGCWYPGSIYMIACAWGMALFDVPYFLESIVSSNSQWLGTKIHMRDIPPLLWGWQSACDNNSNQQTSSSRTKTSFKGCGRALLSGMWSPVRGLVAALAGVAMGGMPQQRLLSSSGDAPLVDARVTLVTKVAKVA